MKLAEKLTKIFSLLLLAVSLASCGDGCTSADEFDTETVTVESKPTVDGIIGSYSNSDGGQRAEWHDTGLVSNGTQFLIKIDGGWTPWNGQTMNSAKFKLLPKCSMCAKNPGVNNCICYSGQTSTAEIGLSGDSVTADCSGADKEDPAKCSCTNANGLATDYGIYHVTLNYADKYEQTLKPDDQTVCRYSQGMGAYIGLFGRGGTTVPTRVYHLFSETETCDVARDSNGKCLDSDGNDVTKYLFRSANSATFVRDDQAGNDGTDTNPSDDTYHSPNEKIKVLMYDGFYDDNYGSYNLTFYGGIGIADDPGLLEYLVNVIDNAVSGEVGDDGDRHGGIIEFMYQALVQDSGAIKIIQISLSIYVMMYGFAVLFGIAEVNKKELMNRVLKISLVIFFTSSDSWYFYNKIVVGFFKDSMDYLVSVFVSLGDAGWDLKSSQTLQISSDFADASNTITSSSRFSYIDTIIKKMLSEATAKKVFGLFFNSIFGFIYIIVIYALFALFIIVMLWAASMYVVNLMKLIFVLSLGPIFMVFVLFKQTEDMFKKWVSYLGTRSLEILIMFFILFNFVMMIDTEISSMLYYQVCVEKWNLGFFSLKTLKAKVDRSLLEWCTSFVKVAGLIFITKLILDKVPDVSKALIAITPEGGKGKPTAGGSMASSMKAAGAMMGKAGAMAGAIAGKAASAAGFAGGVLAQGGTLASRAFGNSIANSYLGKAIANSSIGRAASKAKSMIPFSGPVTSMRNSVYSGELKKAQAAAKAAGLTGKDAEQKIRADFMSSMTDRMNRGPSIGKDQNQKHQPNSSKYLGVNMTSALAFLDKKLVEEPLKNQAKAIAKELKNKPPGEVPLGKDMRDQMNAKLKEWAGKNLSGGAAAAENHLSKNSMKDLIKAQSELKTSEARKKFAGDPALENKYLQHIKDAEMARAKDRAEAKKGIFAPVKLGVHMARNFANSFSTDPNYNAKMARESFLRKKDNAQKAKDFRLKDLGSAVVGFSKKDRDDAKKSREEFVKNVKEKGLFTSDTAKSALDAASKTIIGKESGESRRKAAAFATGDILNPLGRLMNKSSIDKMTREADSEALRNRLNDPKRFAKEKAEIESKYKVETEQEKAARKANGRFDVWEEAQKEKSIKERREMEEAKKIELREVDERMELAKKQLLENARKAIAEDLRGKSEAEKQAMLEKANKDYQAAKEKQEAKQKEIDDLKDEEAKKKAIEDAGGYDALREGLTKLDGTTLLEEEAKLQLLREENGVKFDTSADSSSNPEDLAKRAKEQQELVASELAKIEAELDKARSIEDLANLKKKMEEEVERLKEMEAQKVKELLELADPASPLLKESPIGLLGTAANFLMDGGSIGGFGAAKVGLGGPDNQKEDTQKLAKKNALESSKNLADMKVKMSKMKKKMAEFELSRMEDDSKLSEKDKRYKSQLERDVKEFESDVRKNESSVSDIEAAISSLEAS